MNVLVCSPYGGKEENYQRAVKYCREVIQEGHTPFASHVFYHGLLSDSIVTDREKGTQAGLALISICDEVWVYVDKGEEITQGMADEISRAIDIDIPVRYRGNGGLEYA